MRIREVRNPALVVGIVLVALVSRAQAVLMSPMGPPQNSTPGKIMYSIERGTPYSGVWVTRHVTKFPGGQVVKDENTRKVWRDSEGRTRDETTWTRYNGVVATVGRIEDPVAKVRYTWRIEPGRKTVVTETHFTFDNCIVSEIWPNPPSRREETTPGATIVILQPRREPNTRTRGEQLGPKYLNGVYAEGVRTVDAICTSGDECKAGRTHNHVSEIWTAPDLNMVVRTYMNDGLGFTEDSELKDIERSEPEPGLFLPPPDLPKRRAPETDAVWKEAFGAD